MIVLDVNILLYAYDSKSPFHEQARRWLENTLSSQTAVGLPWDTVLAFLRIATNQRLPGVRLSPEKALGLVESWLGQPNVRLLVPTEQHWSVLRQMLLEGQATSQLVPDAHLAALTIEHGGILHTTDRDFARFPSLRWVNPLESR